MKKLYITIFLSIFYLFFCNNYVAAQADTSRIINMTREEVLDLTYDDLLSMSLEELMLLASKLGVSVDDLLSMKMTVSSKKATSFREQPGIVSVVTRDDIQKSGARDLVDVLRMVPGFSIGYDVQGAVGLGLRGNWGHEGKILLIIDGQEINELYYSGNQLLQHFPIHDIERIEIIRGSGSAIYGGFAELGVINITTRQGKDINGFDIASNLTLMTKKLGTFNNTLAGGTSNNHFDVKATAYINRGNFSQQEMKTFYFVVAPDSSEVPYVVDLAKDTARLTEEYISVSASYKGFSSLFMYDRYLTTGYWSYRFEEIFHSIWGETKYDWKVNDRLTITPKLNYRYCKPWADTSVYNLSIMRYTGSLFASYQLNKNINILGGTDYYSEYSGYREFDTTMYNGKEIVQFGNVAAYIQALFNTRWANLTVGGRFEQHSQYGNAFAPRLGLTKLLGNAHFKLLYSKAFRSPSIGSIGYNQDIKPENTYVMEVETGYKINDYMFVTGNFYNIIINSPIVYFETDTLWGYKNIDLTNTGSLGFELEYRYQKEKLQLVSSYSFYTAKNKNIDALYATDENGSVLLGMPQHKATLSLTANINEYFSINTSAVYLSKCYAYTELDDEGSPVINTVPPGIIANIYLNYRNLFTRGLSAGLGVYDVFNRSYPYVQPYNGYTPPFPGASIQFGVKLSYHFEVIR